MWYTSAMKSMPGIGEARVNLKIVTFMAIRLKLSKIWKRNCMHWVWHTRQALWVRSRDPAFGSRSMIAI